jgi:hypothetical protein
MAIGQVLQFSGVGIEKYDAVKSALGWDGNKNAPEGLQAHAAGPTEDGFCVIDVWDSEAAWDTFFADRLTPAFQEVGNIPQPNVTRFEVHSTYQRH